MTQDHLHEQIRRLKEERRAVILAHTYQLPEVQDIADFVGDSLGLSQQAAATSADVIVFCGVHFMAETAAILCPEKKVLLPDLHSGCPMADMITGDQLRDLKSQYPNATVVCYVNSTAEVKAESDICCTSSNAVAVVESIPKSRQVLFVPDRYLGQFVRGKTGRDMVLWPGYCPTHMRVRPELIRRAREQHPGAVVMVHPECTPDVTAMADQVLSTGGMCRYARTSDAHAFIVGTETGILHKLKQENPGKEFYPVTADAVCPNMKRITLEKILWSLQDLQHVIAVPPEIADKARRSIQRMLAIGP